MQRVVTGSGFQSHCANNMKPVFGGEIHFRVFKEFRCPVAAGRSDYGQRLQRYTRTDMAEGDTKRLGRQSEVKVIINNCRRLTDGSQLNRLGVMR
ncbi:hypothetical protein StoSoilB19_27660 [Arthrobacter sp. StoSoilB19]|nr:hypothetical protein StoSoilB19_27660 [Arthrobacter sp. StoSoilB19]